MAKKTLTDIFGASCTYNSTSGILSFKVTELNGNITAPVTPQKIIVGIMRRGVNSFSDANRVTNTDETIVIETVEKAFSLLSSGTAYEIRETWAIGGYAPDSTSLTANSY